MAADVDWQEKIEMQIRPVKFSCRCVVSAAGGVGRGGWLRAAEAWGSLQVLYRDCARWEKEAFSPFTFPASISQKLLKRRVGLAACKPGCPAYSAVHRVFFTPQLCPLLSLLHSSAFGKCKGYLCASQGYVIWL